jgi:hypothetical protein
MTIPMVVMIVSGLLWFVWDVMLPENPPTDPIPRFHPWLRQVLRIVFAASILVVLWANMTEQAF